MLWGIVMLIVVETMSAAKPIPSISFIEDGSLYSARCQLLCDKFRINTGSDCSNYCKKHLNRKVFMTSRHSKTWTLELLCQELSRNRTTLNTKVILKWSLFGRTEDSESTCYILQGRDMLNQDLWFTVGTTRENFMEVRNLVPASKYQFRMTVVKSYDLVYEPVSSSIFDILGTNLELEAPTNLEIVNYQINSNETVNAILNWTHPKTLPCSYEVFWFPMSGDGFFEQLLIQQPRDQIPMQIPNLMLGKNYSVEISSFDPSGTLVRESSSIDIQTPCTPNSQTSCLILAPVNLTAVWHAKSSEAIISWSAPVQEPDLHYAITIWNGDRLKENAVWYHVLSENATTRLIRNLEPLNKYVVEVATIRKGVVGMATVTNFFATGNRGGYRNVAARGASQMEGPRSLSSFKRIFSIRIE